MKKWLPKSLGMAFVAVGIFAYLFYGKNGELPAVSTHALLYLLVLLAGLATGTATVYANQRLGIVVSWKNSLGLRFVAGFVSQLTIVAAVLLVLMELAKGLLGLVISPADLQPELIKLGLLVFMVAIVNGVFDLSHFTYGEYARGRISQLKHEREQLELQYELLKTQLSPHYLFNSLNTVSSLLDDSPAQAEQFIRRLVQSYQYLIQSQDRKLVKVEEELEFVRAYLFLQKVRFGNALKHVISIGPEKFASNIPPLTIQLLVENAIKHNDFSEQDPLEIVIKEEDAGYICVANESRAPVSEVESLRVGLSNIEKRYSFFTALPVRVASDKLFSVSVPLLP